MAIAELILEFLRVILSTPVIALVGLLVTLKIFYKDVRGILSRTAKIKLPGGAEFSTLQRNLPVERGKSEDIDFSDEALESIPGDLSKEQKAYLDSVLKGYKSTAYLWEYRYLNYFLARGTQEVLDWLVSLGEPTNYSYFDSHWMTYIASANQRSTIIQVLQAHHLITIEESGNQITITPKGSEYLNWRGVLPSPVIDPPNVPLESFHPITRSEWMASKEIEQDEKREAGD